jgi:hypothetical protein
MNSKFADKGKIITYDILIGITVTAIVPVLDDSDFEN